jgi:hypothetical protein
VSAYNAGPTRTPGAVVSQTSGGRSTAPRLCWILPTQLPLFAGTVALLLLASLVPRPMLAPRLVVEAFTVALLVIAAVLGGMAVPLADRTTPVIAEV